MLSDRGIKPDKPPTLTNRFSPAWIKSCMVPGRAIPRTPFLACVVKCIYNSSSSNSRLSMDLANQQDVPCLLQDRSNCLEWIICLNVVR